MIIAAAIALLVGIALGIGAAFLLRGREGKKSTLGQDARVANAATEYLTSSGIKKFNVITITLGDGRLVLLVESEPQKKLRFSSIIEHSLRDHVSRAIGVEVALVFWRFPIVGARDISSKLNYTDAEKPVAGTLEEQADALGPETVSMPAEEEEQQAQRQDAATQYEISEVDWEHFQSHLGEKKPGPGTEEKGG